MAFTFRKSCTFLIICLSIGLAGIRFKIGQYYRVISIDYGHKFKVGTAYYCILCTIKYLRYRVKPAAAGRVFSWLGITCCFPPTNPLSLTILVEHVYHEPLLAGTRSLRNLH